MLWLTWRKYETMYPLLTCTELNEFAECQQGCEETFPKGQLVSKCIFGVSNSSKKRTKTIRLEVP